MSSTKTFEHTFVDTGITVELRKVNPFLIQEARNRLLKEKPKPPVIIIEDDGPLKNSEEINDTDPDYIEALKSWESKVDQSIMTLQIERGVVEVKNDTWKDDVAELRKTFGELGIADSLPDSDLVCFIAYIASGTPADLQEFIQNLSSRSAPTPEAIESAKESFRNNVQGKKSLGNQN